VERDGVLFVIKDERRKSRNESEGMVAENKSDQRGPIRSECYEAVKVRAIISSADF
jgi:hypothetical protein